MTTYHCALCSAPVDMSSGSPLRSCPCEGAITASLTATARGKSDTRVTPQRGDLAACTCDLGWVEHLTVLLTGGDDSDCPMAREMRHIASEAGSL